jgi:DNA helicase-2/ATP-dependent DNA helicase PcrA
MALIFESGDYKKVWQNFQKISEASDFFNIYNDLKKEAFEKPVAATIAKLLEKINYQQYLKEISRQPEERWQNILEFLRLAEDFDNYEKGTLAQFLEKIALFQEGDEKKNERNYVSLMTLHSAKGLEFDVVFVVGVEEGLLPHIQSQYSEEEMEEERRLIYVGMTRAKEEVYLIYSSRRRIFGGLQINASSRFLDEISEDLKQEIELEPYKDSVDPDHPEIELIDDEEYEI